MDSRLRVGRAIGKNEEEVAVTLMAQLKVRGNPKSPPAMATDGRGGYLEAMLETWGQVPEYSGRGRRPTHKQPRPDWHYLQVVKHRSGRHLIGVSIKVIYGTPEEVKTLLEEHTAHVERPAGAEGPLFLQRCGDAEGCLHLGKLDLHTNPTCENSPD